MYYVEKNLIPGEKVVYRGKLHWNIFIAPFILFVIGTFTFAFTTIAAGNAARNAATKTESEGGFSVLLIAGLVWLTLRMITLYTSDFVVTNKRVIVKTGYISRKSVEILHLKVESLGVEQGVLGRVLDFGTLVVSGSGGTRSPFKNLNCPMDFRKAFYEQVESSTVLKQAS